MKKITLFIGLSLLSVVAFPQWVSIPSGTSSPLYSMFFPNPSIGYIVGANETGIGTGIILKTINGGSNWSTILNGTLAPLHSVYFFNSDTGFVTGSGSGILKTIDGGISWTSCSVISSQWLEFGSVYFANSSIGYAAGSFGALAKTVDGGAIWNELTSGTTYALTSIYFPDINTGYASSMGGFVLKTIDGGLNWSSLPVFLGGWINSVYFLDLGTGFVAGVYNSTGVIYKTTDGGSTWNQVSSVPDQLISIYFNSPNSGYAVGENGTVLKTVNGGSTWFALTNGTTGYLTSIFFTDLNNGYIVGRDGIILKTTNGSVLSVEKQEPQIHDFYFYPNPASNSFTISTNNNLSKEALIKIINVQGKLITQVNFQNYTTCDIDIRMFPKGIYFIEFYSKTGVEIKKLIIQ